MSRHNELYEVHLIVAAEQVVALGTFIEFGLESDTQFINVRRTCAVTRYGDHPNQPMLTAWFYGSPQEVEPKVEDLKGKMESAGLHVKRVKIEAMLNNESTPDSCQGTHYYEFHFKVRAKSGDRVISPQDWNRVAKICAPHGVHLFNNSYSRSTCWIPVVTLRRYECTVKKALEDLAKLREDLAKEGYVCSDPEKEYSVMDTNVYLDQGWMFEKEPANFLTHIPVAVPV